LKGQNRHHIDGKEVVEMIEEEIRQKSEITEH
jgi:hypothetical protein